MREREREEGKLVYAEGLFFCSSSSSSEQAKGEEGVSSKRKQTGESESQRSA